MAQVLSGGHGARTYQDERFSYVVMRRGARPGPESIPDLTVARQRQVDPPDAVQRAIEAGEDSPFCPLPHASQAPFAPPLPFCPPLPTPPTPLPPPLSCWLKPKEGWVCHASLSVAINVSVSEDLKAIHSKRCF